MITIGDITALQAIDRPSRVWAQCARIGEKLGFRSSIYACPPPHKRPTHPDTIIRYHGMTDMEFQQFAIQGLIGQGHLTSTNSLLNAKPFRWTDLAKLSKNKAEFSILKAQANQQGIDDGWIFPLYGPIGRIGLGSWGRPERPDLMDGHVGEQLHAFAQMAHVRFCQLTPGLFEIEKPLSPRETQIIAWTALGKSNSEIALILGISDNSIDSYLRRAFTKLDVHDRTSAAVKAISMDLIRT